MKLEPVFEKPKLQGIDINLSIKEALTLRNFLLSATASKDPTGVLRSLADQLSSDRFFGPSIG